MTEYGSALLALQRATHASLQTLGERLIDLDLGASDVNALANLAHLKSCTISELGRSIGIRPTTLTSVLDRLAQRGLITRESRAADRRTVVLRLTPAGEATASMITGTIGEFEREALRGVDATELRGFHVVLEALERGSPHD